MIRWLGILFTLILTMGSAQAEVTGQTVTYTAPGVTLKGYLALNNAQGGKRPGVLVVHEWWGHNEYARNRAHMLAGLGYAALAVDMYGDGKVAAHPDEAHAFSQAVAKDFPTARARFQAALDFLKAQPAVDNAQLAAIGYCFGGGMVLNMARQGVDLKAVASFHGGLDPILPAIPGGIKARLLVAHGDNDAMITPAKVQAFREEMAKVGADLTFLGYPGVSHSFTNPDADRLAREFKLPIAYHPEADKQSWQALTEFLAKAFGS